MIPGTARATRRSGKYKSISIRPDIDRRTQADLSVPLCGWIFDLLYRRRSGARPTKQDRIYFWICIALSLALSGATAYAANNLAVAVGSGLVMLQILFTIWEISRWRIRRKNPIPPRAPSPPRI